MTVQVRAAAPGGGPVADRMLTTLVGPDVPVTTWAGWLWSNAHFVRVVEWSYPTSTVAVPNLVFAGDTSWLLLFAVPPVLLAGAVRGMGVWVGYLPATVLGAFLFSTPTDHAALAPFAPSLVGAVVAGVLYPLVFGSLGGWLGPRLRSRADRAASDEPSLTSR